MLSYQSSPSHSTVSFMTPLISQTLEKLSHLYPGSPTSTNKLKLKELLQGREYEESLRTLTGDDLMRFVEYLDKVPSITSRNFSAINFDPAP